MNKTLKELYSKAEEYVNSFRGDELSEGQQDLREMTVEKFAELITQHCIDVIETYRIPVGNSAAGELACEWTYAALEEIRDEIKETLLQPDEQTAQ